MITLAEVTVPMVDCILRSRQMWRKYLAYLDGRSAQAGGVVVLPVRGGRGSSVERVALARAAVSTVLDLVDEALAELPAEVQQVVRLVYELGMSYRDAADLLKRKVARKKWGHTKSSIGRYVDLARRHVLSRLSLLDESILRDFWDRIGTLCGEDH